MQTHQPLLVVTAALLLGACAAQPPPPPAGAPTATQESIVREGDVTVRASIVQTATLSAEVAAEYGIRRESGTVLLLVAVRKDADSGDGGEMALPAQVTATATDLRGQRQVVAMRELRVGNLLDYVGTVQTTLPDTLRFDITVVRDGGLTSSLQVTREFFPQ